MLPMDKVAKSWLENVNVQLTMATTQNWREGFDVYDNFQIRDLLNTVKL